MMEVLAPAGNRECLERACAAGADAVYLGYAAFSARAGAGNFDQAALREAVDFAHLHHMRVHVTVNTLIKENEMPQVVQVLRLLNSIPVDAVLVQDLGVLDLCRKCFPGLPVHASTQMSIHNQTGVKWCRRMGMTRAVLARECSLSEISKAAQAGIEVEVFGHGAQCVGVSGQCLFSSMIGGRSGNRGRCAQPCRMQYTWRGRTAGWLSPRDVCMRDHLRSLMKAGVSSVKLEGRLKRPEYVAVVASGYRKGVDSAESGAFTPADEEEKQGLLQIFQRGGFMAGYAMGCEDAGVICQDRVNHGGVAIGQVIKVSGGMMQAALTQPLHDGDGLQLRGSDGDRELIYAGHDVPAGETASVRLRPGLRAKAGDQVIRLTDAHQLAQAQAMPIPAIPVRMHLIAYPGKPLTLEVTDGTSTVRCQRDTVAPAKNRALTEEDACRCLEKTGDTPFVTESCQVDTAGSFVPVSLLNAIRREALDALKAKRTADFARPVGEALPEDDIHLPEEAAPGLMIFRTIAQLQAAGETDLLPVWSPEDWRPSALEEGLQQLPEGVWLQLPTVCEEDTLLAIHRFVEDHQGRLGGVILGSVGQLGLDWPVPMGAGEGIPVMNRRAASFLLEQGCRFVTASPELTGEEAAALAKDHAPIVLPAYGRTRLMLLHHCPARTALGLKHGHRDCTLCDIGAAESLQGGVLTDRKGYAFPLLRQRLPEGCLIQLMNALPTDNLSKVTGHSPMIVFTDETPDQVRQVMAGRVSFPTTSGHWKRGVE
ncbi:MAG: U32 family peptidase [Clostridia bacterium]|nr:U32 family peptidase [Clostridia bacterium]